MARNKTHNPTNSRIIMFNMKNVGFKVRIVGFTIFVFFIPKIANTFAANL